MLRVTTLLAFFPMLGGTGAASAQGGGAWPPATNRQPSATEAGPIAAPVADPMPPPTAGPDAMQPAAPGAGSAAESPAPPATPPHALAPTPTLEPTTASSPRPPETNSARPPPGLASTRGIGLFVASRSGPALGARLDLGVVGLEMLGGAQYLFAFWRSSSDSKLQADAVFSGQLGAAFSLTPIHPTSSSAIGLKGGYRYNSVLHHGFTVSAGFRVTLAPHLALEIFEGLSIFPSSSGALRRELAIPSSAHVLYSSSIQFLDEGIELIWYL